MTDDEWVEVGKYSHHCCCFCESIHSIDRKLVEGRLYEKWTFDPALTKAAKKAKRQMK